MRRVSAALFPSSALSCSTARCVPGEGKCVPLSCTGRGEMPPQGTTKFSDYGVVLRDANNGTFPTTVDRLVELLREAYAQPNQSGLPPCFRESPARGASTAGDRLCFRFRRPVKFFGVDFHVCHFLTFPSSSSLPFLYACAFSCELAQPAGKTFEAGLPVHDLTPVYQHLASLLLREYDASMTADCQNLQLSAGASVAHPQPQVPVQRPLQVLLHLHTCALFCVLRLHLHSLSVRRLTSPHSVA